MHFFNALIINIFGKNLKVLYHCGILNSLLIIITLYLLAREFLNKTISFLYAIVFIFALVYTVFLFNSNLPYSFAVVYALSSFLLSLLFIIKYYKSGNKKFAYLSCFFAGMSIANKYEFIFYPFVILWILLFLKPLKLKELIFAIACFKIIPVICLLILIIQGVGYSDLIYTIELTCNIMTAPYLKIIYSNDGVFLDITKLPALISKSGFFQFMQ